MRVNYCDHTKVNEKSYHFLKVANAESKIEFRVVKSDDVILW